MAAVLKAFLSLLLIVHSSRAQNPLEDSAPVMALGSGPQSLLSVLLLGLTVVLSSCIYLWVLRYVCIGCCQPIAVGSESEALADMV